MCKPPSSTILKKVIGNSLVQYTQNMAQVLIPTNRLLKNIVIFEWDKSCQNSLGIAKQIISSDKVLIHYNKKNVHLNWSAMDQCAYNATM